MVFVVQLVTFALIAIGAFAVRPGEGRLAARVARREAERRGSLPLQRTPLEVFNVVDNTTHGNSPNWAGASYSTFPTGTFNSVTGTFVVPTPKFPPGASHGSTYSASIWVGIDGDTFQNAILQTGIDVTVHASTGAVSYDAWYEWWPALSIGFNGISIRAGDTIRATVTATSRTSGIAVLENLTTNVRVTAFPSSSFQLDQANAEWIVEDYTLGGSRVPFVDFDRVFFTNPSATTVSGNIIGPGNATIITIVQNSKTLTSSFVTSSSVTISYVG